MKTESSHDIENDRASGPTRPGRRFFVVLLFLSNLFQSWFIFSPSIKELSIDWQIELPWDEEHTITPEEGTKGNPADLMLTVPFYVYEELYMAHEITIDGSNETLGESIAYSLRKGGKVPKHGDDFYFAEAAMHHPMRVRNPEEAKLFVVPVPLSHIIFSINYPKAKELCWRGMCGHAIVDHADKVLSNSTWFQRSEGKDHIATFGVWGWNKRRGKNFAKCNILGFGETGRMNRKDRMWYKKFYVGRPCPLSVEKTHDLAMIGSLKKDERFQSRRDICSWLEPNDWSVCGTGQQCPALAQSRFGFHVRGDSYGANRLFDTILSGTVPIFTMKQQYGIHPDWYDWDKLSYFADVTNQTVFLESMERILADKKGYEERRQNVLSNRVLFDWTTPYPFDTYMYMLQTHLWPETRRNSTKFSVLKLP